MLYHIKPHIVHSYMGFVLVGNIVIGLIMIESDTGINLINMSRYVFVNENVSHF